MAELVEPGLARGPRDQEASEARALVGKLEGLLKHRKWGSLQTMLSARF